MNAKFTLTNNKLFQDLQNVEMFKTLYIRIQYSHIKLGSTILSINDICSLL